MKTPWLQYRYIKNMPLNMSLFYCIQSNIVFIVTATRLELQALLRHPSFSWTALSIFLVIESTKLTLSIQEQKSFLYHTHPKLLVIKLSILYPAFQYEICQNTENFECQCDIFFTLSSKEIQSQCFMHKPRFVHKLIKTIIKTIKTIQTIVLKLLN